MNRISGVGAASSDGQVNVLNLSLGQDTGGQQMRLSQAWKRLYPADQYNAVTTTHTFYTIQNKMHPQRVKSEWWPAADVVHINNDLRYLDRWRHMKLPRRPLLLHHHGTMYRTAPQVHWAAQERYRATAVCSTVDLYAIAPDRTHWLPQAYSASELQSYRGQREDDGVLRVAHAPTNRAIKSTAALIRAVDNLRAQGMAIELDIIEKVSNTECLRRKGMADVFVDQLVLGYGCNAIEAWGMGLPVIAGVDPEHAQALIRQSIPAETRGVMLKLWGVLPFMEATESTLEQALVAMSDAGVRQQWADIGTRHFNRWHTEEAVAPVLRGLYTGAINGG
jgi:hypothetical protein